MWTATSAPTSSASTKARASSSMTASACRSAPRGSSATAARGQCWWHKGEPPSHRPICGTIGEAWSSLGVAVFSPTCNLALGWFPVCMLSCSPGAGVEGGDCPTRQLYHIPLVQALRGQGGSDEAWLACWHVAWLSFGAGCKAESNPDVVVHTHQLTDRSPSFSTPTFAVTLHPSVHPGDYGPAPKKEFLRTSPAACVCP